MLLVQVTYQTEILKGERLRDWKGDIKNVLVDATVIIAENSPKDFFNKAKLENLSETNL